MDFKKDIDNVKDAVKKGVEDVKGAAHETAHRSTADAEHTRRELDGEAMTPGEKAASMLNEGTNRAQAEIDAAKRRARDAT